MWKIILITYDLERHKVADLTLVNLVRDLGIRHPCQKDVFYQVKQVWAAKLLQY